MLNINGSGYKSNYGLRQRTVNSFKQHSQPCFTAKVPQIPTTSLRDAIEYLLPSSTKILKFLGSNGGEIQNIIINAVGTGLVAPIFIKYNFLSEADQDTRTYSAWRQPVSAVLAIATQAGLTAPFYKMFDNWANNGTFKGALNKTPFQDEYYLIKLAKNKYPNWTDKSINNLVKNIQEEQWKNLIRTLEENNTVRYVLNNGTELEIKRATYRNVLLETVDKLIKTDKTSLNEIEKSIAKRIERGKYYSKNSVLAIAFLNDVYSCVNCARTPNDINTYLLEKMSELKSGKSSKDLIALLDEVKSRYKVVSRGMEAISFSDIQQALLEKVKKMQEHVKEYAVLKSDNDVQQYVENLVHNEKSKLEKAMKFYDSLKTQISEESNVREIRSMIQKEAEKLGIENSGLNKNFTEEVAKQLISRARTNMKWFKQFVGIFVTLSILPFTCALLNWIYPRFMDALFPKLSSKKHGKESAKLIELAPKLNNIDKLQTGNIPVVFGNSITKQILPKKAEVYYG